MAQYGKELAHINAGKEVIYRFFEHDMDNIKLQRVGDMKQYILVEKQSLQRFVSVFSKLAGEFTK